MNKIKFTIAVTATTLASLCSCSSRYRLDLHVTTVEGRTRVKIESSEFAERCGLGNPYSDMKTVAGTTSCLVITMKGRGHEAPQDREHIVRFDEYMTYRLYVELPMLQKGGTVNLIDNAFVDRLGRYDIPAEEKVYTPSVGMLVMDSLSGDFLFSTVHGQFATRGGKTIGLDGQFRVRIAH